MHLNPGPNRLHEVGAILELVGLELGEPPATAAKLLELYPRSKIDGPPVAPAKATGPPRLRSRKARTSTDRTGFSWRPVRHRSPIQREFFHDSARRRPPGPAGENQAKGLSLFNSAWVGILLPSGAILPGYVPLSVAGGRESRAQIPDWEGTLVFVQLDPVRVRVEILDRVGQPAEIGEPPTPASIRDHSSSTCRTPAENVLLSKCRRLSI